MVGFDEAVMQPAARWRRRRFITSCVDVGTSQVIDVFEGRNSADVTAWMATCDPGWLAEVKVVSVDPHEGYRHAICAEASPLGHVDIVVDPFHIVRLANQAVRRPGSGYRTRRWAIAVGKATRSTGSGNCC